MVMMLVMLLVRVPAFVYEEEGESERKVGAPLL